MSNTTPHYLFLTTSTRESGHLSNTEWLAQQAAAALPAGTVQTWHHLARMTCRRLWTCATPWAPPPRPRAI